MVQVGETRVSLLNLTERPWWHMDLMVLARKTLSTISKSNKGHNLHFISCKSYPTLIVMYIWWLRSVLLRNDLLKYTELLVIPKLWPNDINIFHESLIFHPAYTSMIFKGSLTLLFCLIRRWLNSRSVQELYVSLPFNNGRTVVLLKIPSRASNKTEYAIYNPKYILYSITITRDISYI